MGQNGRIGLHSAASVYTYMCVYVCACVYIYNEICFKGLAHGSCSGEWKV